MNERLISIMYDSDIPDLYRDFVCREGQNQGDNRYGLVD